MKISLVVPNRNNLKYFKWSYDSIRKNQGNHEVWICSAVDACTDGTLEYYEELAKKDPYFKFIVNKRKERVGHTILYNMIVEKLVETDLAMIWHCDMYLCPGALDAIEELMVKSKRVVSLTRIEPPLHPPGPEKIIIQGPLGTTEPEYFEREEETFLHFLENNLQKEKYWPNKERLTDGVFAPWTFWVDEFKQIGGHDYLLSPQSKEDDDIWNRFKLNGIEFIQTWKGYVYHMTCRGSRFNPTLTQVGTNSSEWEYYNNRSTRNYIRKWQSWIRHTHYGGPIVNHKYNIGFILQNPNWDLLYHLEPWCQRMVIPTLDQKLIDNYVEKEQPNTPFNLKEKLSDGGCETDIIVEIDGRTFNRDIYGQPTNDDYNFIQQLSMILEDSGEVGEFKLGNLKITVKSLQTYENELIVCKNEPINLDEE